MTMATITLNHVAKRFAAHATPAVNDLSLTVSDGELLVLLGPSGCGKTTSLRMIAGFERPDAGTIRIDAETVASDRAWVPPERRGVGIVFQDYALFPHLTVAQNVAFGILKVPRRERAARVAQVLDAVGLSDYAARHPHELSGGQQQRVALARALAPQPRVLLLDEPFSNLDPELRVALRYEVRAIVRRAGITTVLVTHDQAEAFAMADRIAVMHHGALHQVADPETLYHRPASRFVAGFVGRAQFVAGIVRGSVVETELGQLRLSTALPLGSAVEALVRPDDLQIAPDAAGQATIVEREFGGATVRYAVRLRSGRVIDVIQPSANLLPLDSSVRVEVAPREPVVFATTHAALSPQPQPLLSRYATA
jgi:iron(III) transport system ATP-binding protein